MGLLVNPISVRLGLANRWFDIMAVSPSVYTTVLHNVLNLRTMLMHLTWIRKLYLRGITGSHVNIFLYEHFYYIHVYMYDGFMETIYRNHVYRFIKLSQGLYSNEQNQVRHRLNTLKRKGLNMEFDHSLARKEEFSFSFRIFAFFLSLIKDWSVINHNNSLGSFGLVTSSDKYGFNRFWWLRFGLPKRLSNVMKNRFYIRRDLVSIRLRLALMNRKYIKVSKIRTRRQLYLYNLKALLYKRYIYCVREPIIKIWVNVGDYMTTVRTFKFLKMILRGFRNKFQYKFRLLSRIFTKDRIDLFNVYKKRLLWWMNRLRKRQLKKKKYLVMRKSLFKNEAISAKTGKLFASKNFFIKLNKEILGRKKNFHREYSTVFSGNAAGKALDLNLIEELVKSGKNITSQLNVKRKIDSKNQLQNKIGYRALLVNGKLTNEYYMSKKHVSKSARYYKNKFDKFFPQRKNRNKVRLPYWNKGMYPNYRNRAWTQYVKTLFRKKKYSLLKKFIKLNKIQTKLNLRFWRGKILSIRKTAGNNNRAPIWINKPLLKDKKWAYLSLLKKIKDKIKESRKFILYQGRWVTRIWRKRIRRLLLKGFFFRICGRIYSEKNFIQQWRLYEGVYDGAGVYALIFGFLKWYYYYGFYRRNGLNHDSWYRMVGFSTYIWMFSHYETLVGSDFFTFRYFYSFYRRERKILKNLKIRDLYLDLGYMRELDYYLAAFVEYYARFFVWLLYGRFSFFVIKWWLIRKISSFSFFPFILSIFFVGNNVITAAYMSRFIAFKLERRYDFFGLLNPIKRELQRVVEATFFLRGFKIQFSGRKTRRDRSRRRIIQGGALSLSRRAHFVEYSCSEIILHNSINSIRVWFYRPMASSLDLDSFLYF